MDRASPGTVLYLFMDIVIIRVGRCLSRRGKLVSVFVRTGLELLAKVSRKKTCGMKIGTQPRNESMSHGDDKDTVDVHLRDNVVMPLFIACIMDFA
jgi:hypothetical protein